MKLKKKIGIGLVVAAATYCVLAYIFMWPPVVTNYWRWHRSTSAADPCINNLRNMDAAIYQFAHEHNKHDGDSVTLQDIKPYMKLNMHGEIPSCPLGGKYTVTVVGAYPTCSTGTNPITKIRVDHFFYIVRYPHILK